MAPTLIGVGFSEFLPTPVRLIKDKMEEEFKEKLGEARFRMIVEFGIPICDLSEDFLEKVINEDQFNIILEDKDVC